MWMNIVMTLTLTLALTVTEMQGFLLVTHLIAWIGRNVHGLAPPIGATRVTGVSGCTIAAECRCCRTRFRRYFIRY